MPPRRMPSIERPLQYVELKNGRFDPCALLDCRGHGFIQSIVPGLLARVSRGSDILRFVLFLLSPTANGARESQLLTRFRPGAEDQSKNTKQNGNKQCHKTKISKTSIHTRPRSKSALSLIRQRQKKNLFLTMAQSNSVKPVAATGFRRQIQLFLDVPL